ncbi:MAG: VWA domain-containing protein [Betaproteobacteria bacterium]
MSVIPELHADGGHGRLAENVMHFARVLRAAGLPIGPASVLDAVGALGIAGIERREDWYATLSCIFVKRREHRPLFDQAFYVFWRDPALLEKMMGLMLPQAQARNLTPPDVSKRLAEALLPQVEDTRRKDEKPEQVEVETTMTFSTLERLQHLDFESMSTEEWRAAKSLIAKLRLPIRDVATRRHKPDPRGSRIDLADTLRKSMRFGGDSLIPQYRSRVWRQPPLVVLCDISGSMHRYTRMFLYFLHGIARERDRLHVLLFGTRLTNITRQLRHRDVDLAVNQVAASVQDWAGGTRIGPSLHTFNQKWSRRLLGQNAVVLLISDGLDRDNATELSDEMERLHKSCRELIWLNPLLRFDGFEARPAGIRAMLPHVDRFLPIHNLESLKDLAKVLGAHQVRRTMDAHAGPRIASFGGGGVSVSSTALLPRGATMKLDAFRRQ